MDMVPHQIMTGRRSHSLLFASKRLGAIAGTPDPHDRHRYSTAGWTGVFRRSKQSIDAMPARPRFDYHFQRRHSDQRSNQGIATFIALAVLQPSRPPKPATRAHHSSQRQRDSKSAHRNAHGSARIPIAPVIRTAGPQQVQAAFHQRRTGADHLFSGPIQQVRWWPMK
jgi:hypothetical protein